MRDRSAAALCAVFVMLSVGCTKVDDRLGADLVPKNQKMEIEVTSPSSGIQTLLYREDSVPSSRTGRAYIGRTIDPNGIFGAQTARVLLQFLPYSVPYSDAEGYGIDPIVDSALILLTLNGTPKGDTTRVQRFDVWEVDDSQEAAKLHRDSTFYINFPVDRYKGRKLFEFTHTGRRDVAARLFPTAAGKEYLNSLVKLPWDEYTSDSLFLLKYRGLYITPAEGSPAAAALYGADLTSSGIRLHVRNHDSLDVSAIYDTLTTMFSFRDTDDESTSGAVSWNNVSVNMADFDYSGSVLGTLEARTNGFTDTLPTSTPLNTLYVQSTGGVGPYLRFTDDLIDEIRELKFKTDPATGEKVGKDIFINQAIMRVWLDDGSSETMDASITRLGSYLNPKKLIPIPDYYYTYENYQKQLYAMGQTSSDYDLPYNGYLNRSNAYYELDITSYVQQLAKVKDDDPGYKYISPAIFLGPGAYEIVGAGEGVLKGSGSDQPVSIRITYTIIEG